MFGQPGKNRSITFNCWNGANCLRLFLIFLVEITLSYYLQTGRNSHESGNFCLSCFKLFDSILRIFSIMLSISSLAKCNFAPCLYMCQCAPSFSPSPPGGLFYSSSFKLVLVVKVSYINQIIRTEKRWKGSLFSEIEVTCDFLYSKSLVLHPFPSNCLPYLSLGHGWW